METPFEMSYFLAFGFIGICIYIGVFLRAKIKFLQNFLVPACMIGGIIGMILSNLNLIPLKAEYFQTLAYHFFIVSFICFISAEDRANSVLNACVFNMVAIPGPCPPDCCFYALLIRNSRPVLHFKPGFIPYLRCRLF